MSELTEVEKQKAQAAAACILAWRAHMRYFPGDVDMQRVLMHELQDMAGTAEQLMSGVNYSYRSATTISPYRRQL